MSSPQQDTELEKTIQGVLDYEGDTVHHNTMSNLITLITQREERLVREAELAIADRIEALPSSRRGNVSIHDVSDIATSLRLKHKMRDIALRKEPQ